MNNIKLKEVDEVVFLKNPLNYLWIRQGIRSSMRRNGRIAISGLIGYENLKKNEGEQVYERRYWWLKSDDTEYIKDERKPIDAIEPENIGISITTKIVNLYTEKKPV
jgi:hypothetical protein